MDRDEIAKKCRNGDFSNLEGEGSSKVVETQSVATKFGEDVVYRLYFKGLLSSEIMAMEEGEKKTATAGFGIAICDQTDQLLFEMKEPLNDAGINRIEVEIRALIRGLSESFDLGIRKIVIFCEDSEVYQIIIGRCNTKEKEVNQIREEVKRLREKFASTEAILIARKYVKFAFKLAREAIVSQTSTDEDTGDGENHDDDYDDLWAYGCGCDCGLDSPEIPDYVDYYSL